MQDKLSIFQFFPRIRLEEGGVVQAVMDLSRSLAECGHEVTLATCDASDVPRTWRSGGADVPHLLELSRSQWVRSCLSRQSLKTFEADIAGVDVVHLHTPWELSNLQLSALLHRKKIPYIVTVHGMLDEYSMKQKRAKKRAYLALGGKQLFRRASVIHYTAEAEKEQAGHWVSSEALSTVQACAMDLTPYQNLPGPDLALTTFPQLNSSRKKILFLSRLHPKKGIDLLLRAAALLKSQGIAADILIAGPGEDSYVNELKTLAAELDVSDFTYFLGMIRGQVKLSLYELADVFVLPTHQENFGLVLPEALMCGTPVVTTRGTDIWRELAEAGARIVDNQPVEIALAINDLLSDDEKREQLGAQGREYVKNWLAEEKVVVGYEQMYRNAIQQAVS